MSQRPFAIADHLPGPAGMLGAAANVVLQLGNPAVGYGVVESTVDSGNVLIHPWKRLRTTISYLVVALCGTEDDRDRYRRAVNKSHVPVRSGPDSPVAYNAFDPDLQLWVAACLYTGFRDGRTLFLGPMDDQSADALHEYCHRLGTSLQVPREAWPADRAAFEVYWQAGLARLQYDEPVREHLMKVVRLRMLPRFLQWGNAGVNEFFTIGLLPPQARVAMGLDWTPAQQRRFDRAVTVIRFVTRWTPRWARNLPVTVQLAEVRFRMKHDWPLV